MKLIAIISTILFAGLAQAADHPNYRINCEGLTYAGVDYRLNVDYVVDTNLIAIEAPYTITLNGRNITARLRATENGVRVYRDQVRLDVISAYVTDDQTSYTYTSEESQDWITITPAAAESGLGDEFSYSLNGATGTFRNGKCEKREVRN